MKLQVPFVQLPLRFDAARLAEEISHIDEDDWLPHPLRFAGNSALPLISVHGDARNDDFVGPMLPTRHLQRCPYLQQVLESLGAVWGRARLMRLSGHAEVDPHVDINYYWRERVRVHVPILTQPSVRFICGTDEVNMAAGECWIFDTWRNHRVINATGDERIHLVADTIGSERFWQIANAGRAVGAPSPLGWSAQLVAAQPAAAPPELFYEAVNMPVVMTPWEARAHISFLFDEAAPHAALASTHAAAMRFLGRWHALWARFGESRAGWPEYRHVLDTYSAELGQLARELHLRNGADFHRTMHAMVVRVALTDVAMTLAEQAIESAQEVMQSAPASSGATAAPLLSPATEAQKTASVSSPAVRAATHAPAQAGNEDRFDRPIFIVSPPRSGSTLLFETLSGAPNVYTIGGESHGLIEGIAALHPAARGFASNQLGAHDANVNIAQTLRAAFAAALRDRDGNAPPLGAAVRMLEKTPKNSLRIPFLAQIFPRAQFVYLYRNPREVLASMIEAWKSGGFRTYPKLPGWPGLPWSLVLTPGWRELAGKPLQQIVAAQWQATTTALLDDLGALPREHIVVARYDALLADPRAEIARLCAALGLAWDRTIENVLPLARYTLSQPDPEKWRRHEAEIMSVLPQLQSTLERAETFALRGAP